MIGFYGLTVRLPSGGSLSAFASCSLPAHQIVMRREVLQAVTFEVRKRPKMMPVHECRQLVAHLADATIADFHHVRADLNGVTTQKDKLSHVVPRFDTANA